MKFKILFIWFILIGQISISQSVLDSPFKDSRAGHFEPEPYLSINQLNLTEANSSADHETYKNSFPLYKDSYLYEDPAQRKVRVVRTYPLKNNKHLTNTLDRSYWEMKEKGWKIDIEPFDSGQPSQPIVAQVKSQFPYSIRQFIGCNWKQMNELPIAYFENFGWYDSEVTNEIKRLIDSGHLETNSEGILQEKKSNEVNKFSVDLLYSILHDALTDESIVAYTHMDFQEELPIFESLSLLRKNKEKISGYRTKEDYYINPLNGELTSSIMGLGIVGENQELGQEVIWFYYPEIRFILPDYYAIIDQEILNFEYVFDEHLGNSTITSYQRMGDEDSLKNDYSYYVDLDPLLAIKFWGKVNEDITDRDTRFVSQNETAGLDYTLENNRTEGVVIQFDKNDQKIFEGEIEAGKCVGEWFFYYGSGQIKAIRTYYKGLLNGQQINYYKNGEEFANYYCENGIIQNLERYYSDGSFMEEGKFENGILDGEWQYRLKSSQETFQLIEENHLRENEFKADYKDGFFEFGVKYNHAESPYCPYNYFGNKFEQFCLWAKYY